MKNIIKFMFIAILSLTFFACSEEENLRTLENQSLDIGTFFEKVSNMNIGTNKENIIYINYEWNSKDKTIKYLNSEEKEPDFFILESKKSLAQRAADYQVSCDNGDSSWDSDCSGKWSCGKLIAKCLDEGGCATICQQQMAYSPQTRTFYLLK